MTECVKRKRGAVIETAIAFMILMFAMCAMTTTLAVSVKMRTDRTLDMSNESYSLDQLGEYFLRALEGKSTIDFTKDSSDALEDEGESENKRGGWLKFINSPEDEEDPVVYGLNFSYVKTGTSYVYTMRIADWEAIPPSGEFDDEECELIVTARYDQSGMGSQNNEKLEILNWSDKRTEEQYDPTPSEDMTKWKLFHGFFGKFFGILFYIFRRVMRWRFW